MSSYGSLRQYCIGMVLGAVGILAVVLGTAWFLGRSTPVVPVNTPEVRISESALVASSTATLSVQPALQGTGIASAASKATGVLSVQVRPKNAAKGDPAQASGVPAVDCQPVDLRIALWDDENGTPRAAVEDLNGGEVQATLEFLTAKPAAPVRNWRVGLGIGTEVSSSGTGTLYSASVARRVQERTWIRLDATKGPQRAAITASLEVEF